MKALQTTLFALVAGTLITTAAQAASTYNTTQPYIGAKIGQYEIDDTDNEATSYGIYGGVKFSPNFGIEAEYLTTSEETAWDEEYIDGYDKAEYEGEVYGLYATYNYAFPNTNGLYAKGRLGVAKNEIEVNGKVASYDQYYPYEDSYSGSVSETGIAGGLGLGYDITPNAAVEIAYEYYPQIEDVDITGITLGANFKF